jgi:protein involved in polysaccharide export with SLBB domain
VIDSRLEYRPGDPVRVRVVRREQRTSITDDGAAIEKAGRPRRWREIADRVERASIVNVSLRGVVSLPVVGAGPGFDAVVRRIAEASLDFYQGLLDLED